MENRIEEISVPDETIKTWQEIVDIIAEIAKVPACLIMRLKEPCLDVFVSSKRPGNPYKPGEKDIFEGSGLYCETVIKTGKKLLVPNALEDDNWRNNPDIKKDMISYLGFPISFPDGKIFGTICILDSKRNEYSVLIEKLILKFRDLIQNDLALIWMNQILGENNRKLTDYLMELQSFKGMVAVCSNCKSIRDDKGEWKPIEYYFLRHPKADFTHCICPDCMLKLYPEIEKNNKDREN
ncbi:GAF domain-containing protein [candidate division WOR-3 bacterium]|nr:GAF domain-containing protein [candidate division WOR-3 bacterium]